jgi:ABC-type glycerol-3-phosphate transport system permease component
MTPAKRVLRWAGWVTLYVFLLTVGFAMLLPFWWGFVSSFRRTERIFYYPPDFVPRFTYLSNYVNLMTRQLFPRWVTNSFTLATLNTLLQLFFCSMAGFAFAKYSFRLKNVLFTILIGTTIIPFQLIMTPLYAEMNFLKWLNTYWPLIIPSMAPAFGVFWMRQYMITIPSEILDQARIDGCSEFRIYSQIMMPLAKPALGTLAIYSFMGQWNEYLWPLIVLRDIKLYTLPVGLAALEGEATHQAVDYGMVMAGAILSALPIIILFSFMQRQFISGLTLGAVKM